MLALEHPDGWLWLRSPEVSVCRECLRRWWPTAAEPRVVDPARIAAIRDAVAALEHHGVQGDRWWFLRPARGRVAVRAVTSHPCCTQCPGVLERVGPKGQLRGALEALSSLVHPLRGPMHGVEVVGRPDGIDITAVAWITRDDGSLHRAVGRGKGAAPAQLVGALGECLERVTFFNDAPDTDPLPASMLVGEVIDPRELGLFRREQYRTRAVSWQPYAPKQPIPWRRADDLERGSAVWIMHEAGRGGAPLCRGTTSGWAAHVDRSSAQLGGLLELVERDAMLAAWYGLTMPRRRSVPRSALAESLEARGLALHIARLSHETAVPIAIAVAEGVREGVLAVGGCASSCAAASTLDDAIDTALRGLVQKIELLAPLPADTRTRAAAQLAMPGDHLRYYLDPRHGHILRTFVDGPCDDIEPEPLDGLDDLVARLVGAGYRVLAVDATPAVARAVGLHVVRAVVPGLLPLAFGPLAQARLGGLNARARRLGWARAPRLVRTDPIPD